MIAAVRLPMDLVVGLDYAARELPPLLQDVRSTLNDVARLARGGETGALGDLVTGLARASGPEGELTRLVREAQASKAAEVRTGDGRSSR